MGLMFMGTMFAVVMMAAGVAFGTRPGLQPQVVVARRRQHRA
ncbi:MAG: hypothetical protein AB7H96_12695 [Vicinamibacterales bacterium]